MKKDNGEQVRYGIKAENYFASLLSKSGIRFEFVDEWFDFLVNKDFKVEVKSCQLTVKEGRASKKQQHYRSGRFDFTKEESREKQFNEDIWIAFILRHEYAFMLLGFVNAKKLLKRRFIVGFQLHVVHQQNSRSYAFLCGRIVSSTPLFSPAVFLLIFIENDKRKQDKFD